MAERKLATKNIILIAAAALLLASIAGLYLLRYAGLEGENAGYASFARPDTLVPPPRPGVQGIIISGPIIKDLTFDINLGAADVQPINWNELVSIDPRADVAVRARVLPSGDLSFSRANQDIRDGGHPEAGKYIERLLSTWSYFPYKAGTIRFYFNAPSKGQKLTIDIRDLRRLPEIPAKIRVRDGRLFYIDGLRPNDVAYSSVSF